MVVFHPYKIVFDIEIRVVAIAASAIANIEALITLGVHQNPGRTAAGVVCIYAPLLAVVLIGQNEITSRLVANTAELEVVHKVVGEHVGVGQSKGSVIFVTLSVSINGMPH